MTDLFEVVITAPDPEWLRALNRQLVEDGLCASVHNFAPVRSIYRWCGEIYERTEGRVSLHTIRNRVIEIVTRAKKITRRSAGHLHTADHRWQSGLACVDHSRDHASRMRNGDYLTTDRNDLC